MTEKGNITYFIKLLSLSTFLLHLDSFPGLPFDGCGELEIGNRNWLEPAVESPENLVRRDRNFMDSHSDCVVDSVGHRGNDRKERSLTSFFGAIGSFRIVGFNQDRFDFWCLERGWTLIFQYR